MLELRGLFVSFGIIFLIMGAFFIYSGAPMIAVFPFIFAAALFATEVQNEKRINAPVM